ncbi:ABC transporter substrate-binding protein [Microbacterium betulae]|uniref:ABC transporter substrate-binding protein n=1 Tax=Microbacterium betulae TaxID=2981139 RepID=A0AA97FHC9_9MICO|nr:ABC transporter substrate-binding protein [Microbacterium sp. AB]WOF22564.1 ABC transporter substrate-binding protein [Microbacterium sp. AB]
MHKKAVLSGIGALGVAALLLTGCSGATSEGSDGTPEVTLGALLPQTGDLAALGASTLEAAQLAVDLANESGDVAVTLEVQDSGTDPSIAQTAIQTLIGDGVQGIVGDVSTTVCLSVVDIAAQSEVPMMAPACTSPQLSDYDDGGYFYRTAASSSEQGRALAQLVWDDGNTSAAVLGINDNYGQPIVSTFVEAYEELGGEIDAEIGYDPAARTFAAETQRLAATDAPAIVLIGLEDTSAAIVNDAAQRGLLERQWYMGDGFRSADFPSLALASDPSALYTWRGIGTGSPTGEANDAFAAAFEENLGKAPGSFAAQAYDATWIEILAGIRAEQEGTDLVDEIANVTDPEGTSCIAEECIALALDGESLAYDGATGAVEFNEDGDPVRPVYEVWQFSAEGLTTIETIVGGE